MNIHPNEPYNNLPELPPSIDIETKNIFRTCISANKALAELKGLAQTIPNQSIFVNTISLKEAQYSSEIENIITTTDELYQALSAADQKLSPEAKEVMNYRDALWKGFSLMSKNNLITINIINTIQEELLGNDAGIRTLPGTALKNAISGETIYTPPLGKEVIQNKLKNLEKYIHLDDIDPLIKLALIHYQFEAIHPYYDGNGRTGRILNVLYLVQQKLIDLPILYMSHFIIKNKQDYYTLLSNVTFNQDFEPWVSYMLNCIEASAKETISKIKAIQSLMTKTSEEIKQKAPKIYSKELVEILFHQPYCKIKFLEENKIAKRQTGAEYLRQLEEIGVLSSKKIGRETLFLNNRLFELFKS